MLILLFALFRAHILPVCISYISALIDSVAVIVILLIAIAMMLGLNLRRVGNDAANGVYTVFRDIVRVMYRAIRWLIIRFGRLIRLVYSRSRSLFVRIGLNNAVSTLLAVVITIIVTGIII